MEKNERKKLFWQTYLIGAAPNASGVVCWYLLRLGIVFGAVVLALFVPFADALGVLVPQLFCLPVLAVRLALEKKEP